MDRFWSKVNKEGPLKPHMEDRCWIWIGAHNTPHSGEPYGVLYLGGGNSRYQRFAHRIAYELQVGPIPPGKDILHRCDTTLCVRGSHLRPGTHADNMADKVKRGRAASMPGESNPFSKLTDQKVEVIRKLATWRVLSQQMIGFMFGVSQSTVSAIKVGEKWRHRSID
jgi:HNH endonuclease